ncbi:hypothetical protein ACFOWE_07595 [Planomonospora corallina]|uniref:Uncharacterized protein n=1 Tax=Planomonospora corallina TaxID=1806052 RepID=A0ABV8I1V4_9ACTN
MRGDQPVVVALQRPGQPVQDRRRVGAQVRAHARPEDPVEFGVEVVVRGVAHPLQLLGEAGRRAVRRRQQEGRHAGGDQFGQERQVGIAGQGRPGPAGPAVMGRVGAVPQQQLDGEDRLGER